MASSYKESELDRHFEFFGNPIIGPITEASDYFKFRSLKEMSENIPAEADAIKTIVEQTETPPADLPTTSKPELPENSDASKADILVSNAKTIFNGSYKLTEEAKQERRRKLFTETNFYAQNLISRSESSGWNYEQLIEHIKFLEELRKDLATVHQGWELAKRWHIDNSTLVERQKIAEADKKYKPQYKEREKKEAAAAKGLTQSQKQIEYLINTMGFSREAAEECILGAKK